MEEKKYVLVKLTANWADEFDVNSLAVMTLEEWKELILKIKQNFDPNREYYFGTNEYVTFEDVNDILHNITVSPIDEDFYEQFKQLIGVEFGTINISQFAEE